ncbi:MAG: CARDB domain-containing protein [candidate division WOR-3 bacterium]
MRRYAVLIATVIVTLAAAPVQRFDVNGITLEIRYDPIPGVALARGKVAPLPASGITLHSAEVGLPLDQVASVAAGAIAIAPAAVQPAGSSPIGAQAPAANSEGLPNLFFYAPAGWDYPIVPSNVRNTHTVGPDLNDAETTFFDFAVGNNGTSTARPRFYTYLYRAGSPFAGFYTESLPAGYYTYYNDFPIMVPGGTWTIAGFTDSTNVVVESLENDNRWSRSFTWRLTGGAQPNLRPYTPTGWDYPIVPSNVRNTHTVGPDLNDYDTTFIDHAFINDGNATARPRFYCYLYIDGRAANGYYIDSLPPGWYGYYEDDDFFVPAGDHTLGMFVDSFDVVLESNENDNRWSRTFNWRHDPATLPNLAPYVPDTTWDFPLVPSNVRNTHRVGPNLNDRDTTFIDWCLANFGNAWARPRFYTYTYSDGVPFAGWYIESLPPRSYVYVEDHPRMFTSGLHILMMFIDSTNTVVESDETDNRYSRGFNWQHITTNLPNLTFFTPQGWDYPIVPSNVRNTHTVGPDLNDFDTTFIDFAFANTGSATAHPRFYTYLYEDGTPWQGFYLDSLPAGYYASAEDIPRMMTAGDHELAMFIDSTNTVVESLETDNRWSRTFHWEHRTAIAEQRSQQCRLGISVLQNPADRSPQIRYSLPERGEATVSLHDATGRRLLVLASGTREAGTHLITVPDHQLTAGTYFVLLETGGGRRVAVFVKL